MNSFVLTGTLVRKEAKTSQNGNTYYKIEVQGDDARGNGQQQIQPIPLACFKDLSGVSVGLRVSVAGRLKGSARGQYLNLDADNVEVFSDMQGVRQPPPAQNKYDNPEYQPRRPPPPSTFDAPAGYGDVRGVAQAVANNMRPPEPRLQHDDRVNMDEEGNVIPF